MMNTGHGGARPGAGRKPLPVEEKRHNTTVKVLKGADAEWAALAKKSKAAKGAVVEWLVLSPEAEAARRACIAGAARFCERLTGSLESEASKLAKGAMRRQLKAKLTGKVNGGRGGKP